MKAAQIKKLNELSLELRKVHKRLIGFQKEVFEGIEKVEVNSYDLLKLTLGHEDFKWLLQISGLVVSIDEKLDDPESELSSFDKQIIEEVNTLFFKSDAFPEFKARLRLAAASDPHLYMDLSELRKKLI